MKKLTNQEEEIMLLIYQAKGGFIKDFISLMEKPYPPYTTVASVVKKLERKGLVMGEMLGNSIVYYPTMDESEFKANYLSSVVKKYFENSYKEMVAFFVEKEKLSAEELKEIIQLIEKNK